MNYLNEKIFCYLSEDAANIVGHMVATGWDKDLALAFLEQWWDEKDIYDLPSDSESLDEETK